MQSGTPTHVGANIFNCCICYRRDIRRQYTDLDDVQRVGIIVDRAPQHKGLCHCRNRWLPHSVNVSLSLTRIQFSSQSLLASCDVADNDGDAPDDDVCVVDDDEVDDTEDGN
eukprot:GHVU01086611.1.p1 GENE.GHVU01086611.1~~GHVU01086611.1.p1  ORF type:complete len:112 (+),score=11.91 GHVU01086611.1:160-495(+)